jgi:hypothetical protein
MKARLGALKRAMDINIDELPFVIYACFVLHNFCELNGESIGENAVHNAIAYDREFQPASSSRYSAVTGGDESTGRAVRRILTKYFDPYHRYNSFQAYILSFYVHVLNLS